MSPVTLAGGTKATTTLAATTLSAASLTLLFLAWTLPGPAVLHRGSSARASGRSLLEVGTANRKAAGGAIAKLWPQRPAPVRPAYWLPSELGVHHYSVAGTLPVSSQLC